MAGVNKDTRVALFGSFIGILFIAVFSLRLANQRAAESQRTEADLREAVQDDEELLNELSKIRDRLERLSTRANFAASVVGTRGDETDGQVAQEIRTRSVVPSAADQLLIEVDRLLEGARIRPGIINADSVATLSDCVATIEAARQSKVDQHGMVENSVGM